MRSCSFCLRSSRSRKIRSFCTDDSGSCCVSGVSFSEDPPRLAPDAEPATASASAFFFFVSNDAFLFFTFL
jgi:hypothetical protein